MRAAVVIDVRCRAVSAGERRKSEAERENDREPDPPHGHLGAGWLAGSLAERRDAHQHALLTISPDLRPG